MFLRSTDGRIGDSKHCKVVFLGMGQEVLQHLLMHGGIPTTPFLATFSPAGLELGLG